MYPFDDPSRDEYAAAMFGSDLPVAAPPEPEAYETPPPASLRCVVCKWDCEVDDIALPLAHGVICCRCHARISGVPVQMDKRLRHQIEAAAKSGGN